MARTSLTPDQAPGSYPSAMATLNVNAGDAGNGNQFTMVGGELIIAQNTGAGARTITLTSFNDPYGRLGTITTQSIPAGAFRMIGPMELLGWQQIDGKFYINVEHAEVKLAIIRTRP